MKCARIVLAVLVVTLVAVVLFYRTDDRPMPLRSDLTARSIRLANRTVDPAELLPPDRQPPPALSVRGTCVYAVQCASPVSSALRHKASVLGARVIGFIPQNALLVEASPAAVRGLLKAGDFSAALAYLPADKMQSGLTGGCVTVVPLAESDRKGLEEYIADEGGSVIEFGPSRQGSFRAEVSDVLLAKLAGRGDVRWLERYVPPKFSNDYATADTGVRRTWDPHGLTGAGQVIASADSGLDTGDTRTLHADFTNRVTKIVDLGGYTTADYCGHGTHTAGTIAGDGTMSDGQYRGVAYEAKLYVQACGDTSGSVSIHFNRASSYASIFAGGVSSGAYIHSDSWGSDAHGAYNDFCAGLDEVVWKNPELLVVVACGNAGPDRQTIGSPAAAKNALTVGNAMSSRSTTGKLTISESSSRGPCADGRIKPEIVAPGTFIVSTRSSQSKTAAYGDNSSYTMMSGTSMATPHVAGCAALVRQWLVERQGFDGTRPTAALLKAVLTGGADNPEPNDNYGWGMVSLEETLFPSNREVRLVDRVPFETGNSIAYGVTVTNAAPLDVQLAWIDCPGDISAAQALVNDLDLVVSNRTTGSVWYGNGIVGGDRTNTVESVRIPFAETGSYSVIVRGESVPYGREEGGAAALYIRGAFAAEEDTEFVTLTVAESCADGAFGLSSPMAGEYRYPKGSTVTLSALNGAYGTNDAGMVVAVYACEGFIGTGSVPSAATNLTLQVTLDEDSTIEWLYAAEPETYTLRFWTCYPELKFDGTSYYFPMAGGRYTQGAIGEICYLVDRDETVEMAIPGNLPRGESVVQDVYSRSWNGFCYYGSFAARLGDVEVDDADGRWFMCYDAKYRLADSAEFTMNGPKDVFVYYYGETTMVDGVLPLWWYERYLNGSVVNKVISKDESMSAGDPDGDGFDNGTEYADATDPVDDASFRFQIDAFSPTGMTFTGSVKGNLIVERCDRLGGEWKGVLTNSQPRESTVNTVNLDGLKAGSNGFFRVIYRAD